MSKPGPSKSTSGPDGSSNLTKSHDPEKKQKVTKSAPKTEHTGGGDRHVDPICRRVGGLVAPAGTNVGSCGSAVRKMSTAGLQKPKKVVPDRKKHRKSCPEAAQKRPSAQHGRARLREATKTQQNVITERRAPRKHEKGVKQKHERKPPTTTNADVNQHLLHGNIDVSTMFKSIRIGAKRTRACARSSPPNGGHSTKCHIYIWYSFGSSSRVVWQ